MQGRYGGDNFGRFLIVLYFLLFIFNTIALNVIGSATLSFIVSTVAFAVIAYGIFRMLSRDYYKRQNENQKYLRIKNAFTGVFRVAFKQIRDPKHKYVRCRVCGAVIRFPRKKGAHTANCPKCRADMKVKVTF